VVLAGGSETRRTHLQRGSICGEEVEGAAIPLALKYLESEQRRLTLHKLAARIKMEANPRPVAYQEVRCTGAQGVESSLCHSFGRAGCRWGGTRLEANPHALCLPECALLRGSEGGQCKPGVGMCVCVWGGGGR